MMIKKLIVLASVCGFLLTALDADAQRKKTEPDPSQGAVASQTIGVDTEVTITYHRPGVKGRDVWTGQSDNVRIGALVPRNGDPRPWRGGANEATTISFSSDVLVEGQDLAAGTYALFFIPTNGDWTVVFNTAAKQWGSFGYKQDKDALRVNVTPADAPHQEWLVYGFDDPAATSTTAYLHWAQVKIPFKIEAKD